VCFIMANWTAVTAFLAVGVLVGEILYREYLRIKSRRIAIVDGIFPILTVNIRESMHNYEVHYNNRSTSFTNFHTLRHIVKNGEIEKIKKVDKKTYDLLVRVEKEIITKIFDMDERKRVVFDEIKAQWVEYVTDPSIEHIHHNHTNVMNRLYVATHLHLFNDDLSIIENKYLEVIAGLIEEYPSSDIQYFPDGTTDVLIQIVKENMVELKQLDNEIRRLFNEIIDDKLLPRMATVTRDTV